MQNQKIFHWFFFVIIHLHRNQNYREHSNMVLGFCPLGQCYHRAAQASHKASENVTLIKRRRIGSKDWETTFLSFLLGNKWVKTLSCKWGSKYTRSFAILFKLPLVTSVQRQGILQSSVYFPSTCQETLNFLVLHETVKLP